MMGDLNRRDKMPVVDMFVMRSAAWAASQNKLIFISSCCCHIGRDRPSVSI